MLLTSSLLYVLKVNPLFTKFDFDEVKRWSVVSAQEGRGGCWFASAWGSYNSL